MKNFSLILNVLLLIAVAILFYLHFQTVKNNIGAAQPTISRDSSSLIKDTVLRTTAFINTDTLFEKYVFVKEMRDELAAEKLRLENSYNTELKKLEKEVYEFQDKAPYMTQQEGETKQLELAEKEQKLIRLERELSAKMVEKEMEKNKQIQRAVTEYLEKLNKEKNYAYVFGYNGTGNVLLANPQFDITNELIEGLNGEFNKVKAEAGAKKED